MTKTTYTSSRKSLQRWYMGFKQKTGKLKPEKLIEIISKQIQFNNLAKYLPVLRMEKSPKGEYYFFIAIESEVIGILPANVQKFLDDFKYQCFNFPVNKKSNYFDIAQIKPMVGLAHDVQDYTNPIPYRLQSIPVAENPLDLADSYYTQDLDNELIKQLSGNHQNLLYWLSASGNGTWESFRKTCEILNLSEPRRILRRLKLLKYLTTSNDGSKWQVNPPSLLKISTDLGNGDRTFLLYGQRSAKFMMALKVYGLVEETYQFRGEAPPCIYFTLPSQITVENLIEKMQRHDYFIKLSIPSDIPCLEAWSNSLPKIQGILPFNYDLKQFNGKCFVDCAFQNQTGFYQFWNTDTLSRPKYSFFYDQNSKSWLQGDWYGLRFLAISHIDQSLNIQYYPEQQKLEIPFDQRWAEDYETHLVMASGVLPAYKNGWLIYRQVSRKLAMSITKKLKLTLEEY